MTGDEYARFDAVELARLVRMGDVRASELVARAAERADSLNEQLNAIVYRMDGQAREAADAVDREHTGSGRKLLRLRSPDPTDLLRGVPVLIKDIGVPVAGAPMRAGCRALDGTFCNRDGIVARRLRGLGVPMLGKTNTPELGITPYTESELYGPCRNPWDTGRTPGGSSGGSAAAVAAGIVPIATASDGGGSIRIPAACCGLFGLKPSRGRIPIGGDWWGGGVSEHCLTRSVRDSAGYLDLMSGAAAGQPYLLPRPSVPYREEVERDPAPLMIGMVTEHPFNRRIHPTCKEAVENLAGLLERLGHRVEEVSLPYPPEALTHWFFRVVVGSTAARIAEIEGMLGRRLGAGDLELNTRLMRRLAQSLTMEDSAVARESWNLLLELAADFHTRYDMMLSPSVSDPPPAIGAFANSRSEGAAAEALVRLPLRALVRRAGLVDRLGRRVLDFLPYTPFANMSGAPSMSVPTGNDEDGLPVGAMFTAPMCREDMLFRLAGSLERELRWTDRLPVVPNRHD